MSTHPSRTHSGKPIGSAGVASHGVALWTLEWVYRLGTVVGTGSMLLMGGLIPVTRRWLNDELEGWPDVVETLGGVWPSSRPRDPDSDLGPVLTRTDASELHDEIRRLCSRAGIRPPGQVRLTFLPCCGAVEWKSARGRSTRALLIGLPLFPMLSVAELRAVLAHEIAHLAHGDSLATERSTRFLNSLTRTLDPDDRSSGLLGAWARLCCERGLRWHRPLSLGREARADRFAASVAGGDAAASALVNVALVQSIFREVLDHYQAHGGGPDDQNLYGFFRTFWSRLPGASLQVMRHGLLSRPADHDALHPSLADRLALVQGFPAVGRSPQDDEPATVLLGDVEAMELMLHRRLFSPSPMAEPSVFHRIGS